MKIISDSLLNQNIRREKVELVSLNKVMACIFLKQESMVLRGEDE
jgi:hypothetical protein